MVGVIKMIDLVGNRYGKLVVISEEQPIVWRNGKKTRRFKCLCDCGNTTIVPFSAIVYGITKSCGCLRGKRKKSQKNTEPARQEFGSHSPPVSGYEHSEARKKEKHHNMVGNRYGMLTVIRRAEKPWPDMSNHLKFWECVCDCGNYRVVFQGNLTTGHTRSCGCLSKRLKRGVRFGKLTILSAAPVERNTRYYNVRCDCGMIHTVSRDVLFRAANVYCDCGSEKPRIDLTGQQFGRLTVLMRVDPVLTPSGKSEKSWLCRCVCGREVVAYERHLLSKTTRSCGCLRRSAAKQFDPMSKRQ